MSVKYRIFGGKMGVMICKSNNLYCILLKNKCNGKEINGADKR